MNQSYLPHSLDHPGSGPGRGDSVIQYLVTAALPVWRLAPHLNLVEELASHGRLGAVKGEGA